MAERVSLADDPRYADVAHELSERLTRRMAKPSFLHVGAPVS